MANFDLGDSLAAALGSVPAPGSVRTPEIIGEEVRSLTRAAKQMTLWFGVEIGRRLTEAKEMVGHGGWLEWLKAQTEFSTSSAARFMKLYAEYGSDQKSLFGAEVNFPALGNLSVTNALALLAVPAEEREEFALEVDAEHISSRDLQEAIRERDEARKALDTALADAKKAEEYAAGLSANVTELKETAEAAKAEASLAAEARDKLSEELKLLARQHAAAEENAKQLRAQIKELEARPRDVAVQMDEKAVEKVRAEMQKKLDKAEKAAKEAGEKRAEAEAAMEALRGQLAAAEKANAAEKLSGNSELGQFILLYNQISGNINMMHGMLLKVRNAGDDGLAGKMAEQLLALAKAVKECAG